ncbi:MAG: intradiol ring-cleavage dioxygenase, partial [bacterium]|nr:intradiol ring-cleavage dioxygenase [bacterium]
GALLFLLSGGCAAASDCPPTKPDMLGPFYVPDAPVRERVGQGYLLRGFTRSTTGCSPIAGAKIEFWLTGPEGDYDDNHRATVYSDDSGAYRFESNRPRPYFGRPSHIHIRVSADGFKPLVTQHYPEAGKSGAIFDLVLIPVSP